MSLPAPQTLPELGICSLLTWCHLEAESSQGLVSFLWGREALSSQASGSDTPIYLLWWVILDSPDEFFEGDEFQ